MPFGTIDIFRGYIDARVYCARSHQWERVITGAKADLQDTLPMHLRERNTLWQPGLLMVGAKSKGGLEKFSRAGLELTCRCPAGGGGAPRAPGPQDRGERKRTRTNSS